MAREEDSPHLLPDIGVKLKLFPPVRRNAGNGTVPPTPQFSPSPPPASSQRNAAKTRGMGAEVCNPQFRIAVEGEDKNVRRFYRLPPGCSLMIGAAHREGTCPTPDNDEANRAGGGKYCGPLGRGTHQPGGFYRSCRRTGPSATIPKR